MKKINEMSVKELREVAKEMNIAGRWDMTKTQLVEAIEEIEKAKEAEKKEKATKKAAKKAKAICVQRAFIAAGEARKEVYRYITITVKNVEEDKAADYVNQVCAKMTELDEEFHSEFKPMNTPAYDEETKSYTDTISFEKAKGKIAVQRQYVGKLMTKAMAAIK